MANPTPDFAQFPFDYAVQAALKSQGFSSIYDILDIEESRFRQQYDIALNGYAGAIYQQAKNYLGMADSALRQQGEPVVQISGTGTLPNGVMNYYESVIPQSGDKARMARYAPPLYNLLFSDEHSRFVEPGSLQSLDSPVSYLVYLLSQLKKMSHTGSSALHSLLARRPDIGSLLLNDDAFTRALPTSELVWEILCDAFKAVTRVSDIDGHLAKGAVYPLTLPFDIAHTRIALALDVTGHSFGDVFSMLVPNYRTYSDKSAAALAWSGVTVGLHDELLKPATSKCQPVILQFDERGQPVNGEALFLQLASLFPGTGVKASDIKITAEAVICKAISKSKNLDVTFTLSFNAPPQALNELSVTAARTSVQECAAGELYWGSTLLKVVAKGQPNRTLSIGVLAGDEVGTETASQAAFKEEAALLETYLGPDVKSAVAAQMSVPVDMLCQAAGITARQLQEAFALGDFVPQVAKHLAWPENTTVSSGLYGARYLWGQVAGLEGALPGTIHAGELKTTVYQLHRLQKLIRLQHHTQLPFAALDGLIQAAIEAQDKGQGDINRGTVRALGVYKRYQSAFKLDAEQVAVLWGDITPYAQAGQTPLLDRVLAPAGHHPDFTLPLSGTTELSNPDIALLAHAFAVPAATLKSVINEHKIKKTLTGVSALYRLALLAAQFSLSVEKLLDLIVLVCSKEAISLLITPCIYSNNDRRDTLDLLVTLDEVMRWASQEKLVLADMLVPESDAAARDLALITVLKVSLQTQTFDKILATFTELAEKGEKPPTEVLVFLEHRNKLAALASAIGQHAHLDPSAAWALMVFHQKLLNDAIKADSKHPVSLAPLFLSAELIKHYKLDEVALTPLLRGKSGMNPNSSLWELRLALNDFARLALGDERVRPVLLAELDAASQQKRLAQGYEVDVEAVKKLIPGTFVVAQEARLQRLVDFSRTSGWSLNDLLEVLEDDPINQAWLVRLALSKRCGPHKEAARNALDAKVGELRNKALLALYKSTCRRGFIQSENKTWAAAFGEHEPDTIDVAGQLLIDPEMSARVSTSRVAEAIASVQAFMQRIADGREREWQLTAGELQRWRNNDSRYAIWAANLQLRWHPDQYINPTTRQNKTQSFSQLENSLSQARLDQDSVEIALAEYLQNFEQVVNLDTIGAYQDGMNSSQSPIYFLGRSPSAPFEYYSRRWGIDSSGLRRWSAWRRIDLPTSSNVMAEVDPTNPGWKNYAQRQKIKNHLPVQARLVALNGRLNFIWVEARVVTPEHMVAKKGSEDSTESKATKKQYRHVISLVHRRMDGSWSNPVELYQGVPAEYLDPAPNLAAFVIPQYAADLETITYAKAGIDSEGNQRTTGAKLFDPAPAINGDLLLISLLCEASNPKEDNASSQYWLFDGFLDEIRTSPRWGKDTAQRQSRGLDLESCDSTNTVVKTINDLNSRSYFRVKEDSSKKTYSYSTQVITPVIPNHWLFNERQWISRGEAVFGNAVSLHLIVEGAGVSTRDSYRTISTVTLTAQQWAAVPKGSKLVHFLSVRGRAKYQQVMEKVSTVALSTVYPTGPISVGEVYHGVMLIPNSSSIVIAINNVDNALIEQGQLAVAHDYVEKLGAEIRENARGVQYLVTQYLEGQNNERDGHSLHGTPQPVDDRQTVKMTGVACKLFVNLDKITDITANELGQQDNWMSADFVLSPDGTRLSLWSFDVPADKDKRKQVWLVTRVKGSIQLDALKTLKLPNDVKAYQLTNNKLAETNLSGFKTEANDAAYLLTQITVPDSPRDNMCHQNCSLPSADMKVFSAMTFTFLLTRSERLPEQEIVPAGVMLRVVSERELQEDLQFTKGKTVFTPEDWGWMAPAFSTTTKPYTLNRTYRLPSPACQYFVVKVACNQVAVTAIGGKKFIGFSISVQSPLTLPGYVVGLKGNVATKIELDGKLVVQQGSGLGLIADSPSKLQTFLDQYDALFFALPWTANSFSDVQQQGLRFQLSNLKGQDTIQGYIPCEVPTLSTAIITSSCSPSRANVGDVVQITANIDLGTARFSDGAHIEIALNNAYELLVSGISVPAGTQVSSNLLALQMLEGQRDARFSLPVRVLDNGANVLPLATVTVADKRSVERILLDQPTIGLGLNRQIMAKWNWQYGNDPAALLTSATDRPITTQALKQNYLLTVLTLTPQPGDTVNNINVTLTLPKGITVESDSAKLDSINKVPDLKKSLALLEKGWKDAKITDDGTTVSLVSNMKLEAATQLILPLKLDTKNPFIGVLDVEVTRGDETSDSWTAKTYPIWQPNKNGVVAVSAGCEPGNVEAGYSFAERVTVFLLMEGLGSQETLFTEAKLHLPPQFSYTGGRISSSTVLKQEVEARYDGLLTGSYEPNNGELTIPLNLTLKQGQQYIVLVQVDAIPDLTRKPGDTTATFSVFMEGLDPIKTPDIKFGNALISGVTSNVFPMLNSGASPIRPGSTLPVGATFNYRVLINMSEAELKRQFGRVPADGGAGPLLTLRLADSLELVSHKVHLADLASLSLTKAQATHLLMSSSKLRDSDYGIWAESNIVTVQTRLMPNQGVIGEYIVPVRVIKAGPVSATLSISPTNSNLKQPESWTKLVGIDENSPTLVAYDTNTLPLSDMHFAQSGAGGFTDPIPLKKPALLDAPDPVTSHEKRLVRLNTQFGQELVRIAQRDTNAVFLAATQDHPLLPMEGENPEPLEQDAANLLYFWELFYHVPALIAYKLNAEGRYDEAQEWLHRLMDPFPTMENGHKKAIWRCRLLLAKFSYVTLDHTIGPVDPDTIASVQPEFYRRAVFNAYVKNLLDKGDSLYRELSRDGFNGAHQCYLLVAHLLGADFAPARVPAWVPLPASLTVDDYAAASAGRPGALFALPRSQLHQSLVHKLQQRLFNLRNGLTLDGKPLDLPLYDKPIDPGLLQSARVGGMQTPGNLQATPLVPLFRYNVLYARTSAAVDVLIQFGNDLLSLIDRQQEMRYQSLLIGQQKEMAAFVIGLQKDTLRANEENRLGLEAALDSAKHRLEELSAWIEKDVSDQESQALSLRSYASTMGVSSAAMRAVGAGLDLAPNIIGLADGGSHWGAIPQAVSDGLMAKAEADNGSAMQIETREMYRHRLDEWKVSKKQTEGEVKQLEAQLRADTIQQGNLQRQLAQYEAQLRQFDEQRSFMENRFTNVALYQWLTSQVSALYYQAYDTVASLCLMTQAAWRYEVADYSSDNNFFINGGWNDARRGLLAGETLRLGLLRMDLAYLSRAERMLEINHTFSLKAQIAEKLVAETAKKIKVNEVKAPLGAKELADQTKNQWTSLLKFNSGSALLKITISVTEKMLAMRYPGHYLRQLVAVSVTLPCVVGPYEEVCATLTQISGRFAIEANDETYAEMSKKDSSAKYIVKQLRPASSVALSSGLDDAGAFVLNFGDEKFMPFEGNGVVGEWELRIPNPGSHVQKRMLESLNDIIVTLRYRAKDKGDKYAQLVLDAINKQES